MEGKFFVKKLGACLLLGMLVALLTVPAVSVSAASTVSKHWYADAGDCYHLMNNSIAKNKITSYALYVQKMTEDAKFDLNFAYQDEYTDGDTFQSTELLKECKYSILAYKGNSAYLKSSDSSDQGMLACIKVTSGRVRVKIRYTTDYARAKLNFVQQPSGHQPMRGYKVPQGKQISFTRRGGSTDFMQILMAAPKGCTILEKMGGAGNYIKYDYNADKVMIRFYENKIEDKRYRTTADYFDNIGSKLSYVADWPRELGSTCTLISKKGTVSYYYPMDYYNVSVKK